MQEVYQKCIIIVKVPPLENQKPRQGPGFLVHAWRLYATPVVVLPAAAAAAAVVHQERVPEAVAAPMMAQVLRTAPTILLGQAEVVQPVSGHSCLVTGH